MVHPPPGSPAVTFLSGRSGADDGGQVQAAAEMEAAAALRDGVLGLDSVRDVKGMGVMVSWWQGEAAALGWRDDPDHSRIQDRGRALIAKVDRACDWTRPTGD